MQVNNALIGQIGPFIAATTIAISQYLQALNQANQQLDLERDIYSVFHAFIENDYDDVMWRHRPLTNLIENMYSLCHRRIQSNAALNNGQVVFFTLEERVDTINILLRYCMQGLLTRMYGVAAANNMLHNQPYDPLTRNYAWYLTKEVGGALYSATITPIWNIGSLAVNTVLHPVVAANNVAHAVSHPIETISTATANAYDAATYEVGKHPVRALTKALASLLMWGGPSGPGPVFPTLPRLPSQDAVFKALSNFKAPPVTEIANPSAFFKSLPTVKLSAVAKNVGNLQPRAVSFSLGANGAAAATQMAAVPESAVRLGAQAQTVVAPLSMASNLDAYISVAFGVAQVTAAMNEGSANLNPALNNQTVVSADEVARFIDGLLACLKRDNLITDPEIAAMKAEWLRMANDAAANNAPNQAAATAAALATLRL